MSNSLVKGNLSIRAIHTFFNAIKQRAYPNNRVVMRPSPDISGRPRRQAKKARRRGFFSTLRTFLADNAGIGLPLGIERVSWIGS